MSSVIKSKRNSSKNVVVKHRYDEICCNFIVRGVKWVTHCWTKHPYKYQVSKVNSWHYLICLAFGFWHSRKATSIGLETLYLAYFFSSRPMHYAISIAMGVQREQGGPRILGIIY